MDNDSEYDIGYRKPPRAFQFRKGKSGNPRGRPARDQSLGDVFRKVAKQTVRTNGQNGEKSMSKLEASMTQLINKAASGDLKAMKVLLQTAHRFPELITGPPTFPNLVVTFEDDPNPDKSSS